MESVAGLGEANSEKRRKACEVNAMYKYDRCVPRHEETPLGTGTVKECLQMCIDDPTCT